MTYGDNPKSYFVLLAVSSDLSDGQNILCAPFQCSFVTVKACNDLNAKILEAVIIKKRSAEFPRSDKNCICQLLIPEMVFNVGNQLFGFITNLGLAGPADSRKILTNLNVAEL